MPAKTEETSQNQGQKQPIGQGRTAQQFTYPSGQDQLSPLKIDINEFIAKAEDNKLVSVMSPPSKIPFGDFQYFPPQPKFGLDEDSLSESSLSQQSSEFFTEKKQENRLEFTEPKARRQINYETPRRNKKNRRKQVGAVCHCKKSRCLKFYCDCFKLGQVCGENCQCVDCHNTEAHQQRSRLIQKERNSKGCNCKRSGCEKGYCECYQAGLKCTHLCKCQLCKNMGQPYDEESRRRRGRQRVERLA